MAENILGTLSYRKVKDHSLTQRFHKEANARNQSVCTSAPAFNQLHWKTWVHNAAY